MRVPDKKIMLSPEDPWQCFCFLQAVANGKHCQKNVNINRRNYQIFCILVFVLFVFRVFPGFTRTAVPTKTLRLSR